MDIYLNNTLTRKKERFVPNKEGEVGIYSCGPTVYWNQHIGHMYAYVQWDVLVRFLRSVGYNVKWVMNITDVGHMTSDEDTGLDKMEKGAKREGLTVWQIADKYITQFKDSLRLLGINSPDVLCRATENIPEQIKLNQLIEKNGFAYTTKKGLIYDTSKFPDYAKFANLNLEEMKSGGDVELDPEKKLPWDFFLWAIDPKHIMKWPSPWGEGYPGWHVECTAMSTKYLGNNFDIHTGGADHIPVHHTNEIAQGFAAFGKQTANYWLHNGMLGGKGGEKMSKSLGNFVTAQELVEKGYDPLAMRYLILTSHYKKGLNFTFDALDSAKIALENLRTIVSGLKSGDERTVLSPEKEKKLDEYRDKFISSLSNDINAPKALAVLWEMLKSNIPSGDKYDLALSFDEVLGLKLSQARNSTAKLGADIETPNSIKILISKREELRKEGKYGESDKIREQIEEAGYEVSDAPVK
ncbi:MAG: Cysteine-tRNA ligase [Candidatus Woesebacteria bacterium GW2011_GWA2_40_7b]|uniref:Cysteine--tRNA ligase n=1 Tax=Candidatus Woesebacteria bacterium GW2011_GWA2_40_7b TaxID=1618563 RepID=A0A0G0VEJ8_9BACT|nr:MAG: Cysteine-tRNA ligase [Candidatus Woesebacteria bacterium GW2011_GWA2_40_7b]